jgi:tRNA dimethylallyltransferase
MSEPRLLVVVGPTASGKSELAIRLCEKLDGEIISADSVQVYRYFNCGTGKPAQSELERVSHHLVDILDPLETIDAAGWAKRAESALTQIRKRGKIPVVCGGTFLWVRALLYGLAEAPAASPEIRKRHQEIAEAEGRAALHAQLIKCDPICAERLNPNDLLRVSRALEVFELTGTPMSQWQAEHGFREQKHAFKLLGVHRERDELDQRISERTGKMLESGWVDEVRNLVTRGYGSARAMGSVGYRQVQDALTQGNWEPLALHDSIIRATRVFVRRQRTWLRDEPVRWVKPGDFEGLLDELALQRREFG